LAEADAGGWGPRKSVFTDKTLAAQRRNVALVEVLNDGLAMMAETTVFAAPAPVGMGPLEPETFYRNILENLAEGVMLTDVDHRIVYVNELVTRLTGYSREELLGADPCELLVPKDRANQPCEEPVEGQRKDLEILRKDGKLHWVSLRITPFRNTLGELSGRLATVNCLKKQKELEHENEFLNDEIRLNFGRIIGNSPRLRRVLSQVATVGPTEANVLILGESGTGKELVARAIHDLSPRKDRPLVRVNCASVPKDLFESEFFGHVRGAFTGAIRDRVGRFELADGGTLLLDEVGEIPLDLQSKLLRVLQEGQFERLGEDRTRTVQVRLLAATNRDLLAEAKAGRFRLDLYYRLSVFPIELPPLRQRLEDIGLLVEHFLQQSAERLGVARPGLTQLHLQELQSYDWPGNVRELQNVVERAVILARGGTVRFDLPQDPGAPRPEPRLEPAAAQNDGDGELSLDELDVREREIITIALRRTNSKIYGRDGAAALLKIKPTSLVSKMKRLNIAKT